MTITTPDPKCPTCGTVRDMDTVQQMAQDAMVSTAYARDQLEEHGCYALGLTCGVPTDPEPTDPAPLPDRAAVQPGRIVTIYRDPLTREHPEGRATLVEPEGVRAYAPRTLLETWYVRFEADGPEALPLIRDLLVAVEPTP